MGIAFDTLAYARKLREAGFDERQAEGQAEALAAAMTDTLASRKDLEALATRQELRDLAAHVDLRCERVEARIDSLERRMDERFQAVDERFAELNRYISLRLSEQSAQTLSSLADLEAA